MYNKFQPIKTNYFHDKHRIYFNFFLFSLLREPNLFKNLKLDRNLHKCCQFWPNTPRQLERVEEKRRTDSLWSKPNTADCDNQRDNKIGAQSGIGNGRRVGDWDLSGCSERIWDRLGGEWEGKGTKRRQQLAAFGNQRKTKKNAGRKALNFDNFHANKMRWENFKIPACQRQCDEGADGGVATKMTGLWHAQTNCHTRCAWVYVCVYVANPCQSQSKFYKIVIAKEWEKRAAEQTKQRRAKKTKEKQS